MFYGWKVAAIGSCGNLLTQGSVFYVMNAFIEPLAALHGWSRGGIGLAMGFASIMMTLSMPFGIILTNHVSIRLIMTLGAFVGGLCYIALGHVDRSGSSPGCSRWSGSAASFAGASWPPCS